MRVTIILPTLNEEEGILQTLDSMPIREMYKQGYDVEILVIDGGSKDRTREIAESKGARVILSNRGYGLQYRVGFKNAKGDIIVTADADGSYPVQDLLCFLSVLAKKELSFISVRRKIEKGAMDWTKKAGNFFLTLLTNIFFGLKLKDSQSGMWIFKRSLLNKIRLVSNGMSLSEEIKIEAFTKFKSMELMGTYTKRIGKCKLNILKDGLENLLFLFKKRTLL